MKLLSSPTYARQAMRSDDTMVQGVEAALVVAVFLGAGYALDRWLGTTPWIMIGMFLLGVVGLFVSWKAKYTARMDELEARRRDDATRHRPPAQTEGTL